MTKTNNSYKENKKLRKKKIYHYDIREYQLRSVCLLETIDKVCKKYGIKYYIIAGTLLGAVRHKGFIPWDDDQDIALMRKDYDMLMQHASEWVPEPFSIVNNDNCAHYPKYFAKLEDTSTTIVERLYLGYAGGIYMDIFPLDDVPENKILRAIHFYKFNLIRNLLYFSYRDPYKHGKGPRSWFPLLVQKLFTKEKLHALCQKILKEYDGHRNCNLVMTHDDGFRAYSKEIFGEPKQVVFEGVEVDAPSNPDGFLSVLYGGNYMELPPVEARRSHFHDYCDLTKPYAEFDINNYINN
jgi:lipopolysaccharide cholinephosphotransferase